MTTLGDVARKKPEPSAQAEELVRLVREQGLFVTGLGGLLSSAPRAC